MFEESDESFKIVQIDLRTRFLREQNINDLNWDF